MKSVLISEVLLFRKCPLYRGYTTPVYQQYLNVSLLVLYVSQDIKYSNMYMYTCSEISYPRGAVYIN